MSAAEATCAVAPPPEHYAGEYVACARLHSFAHQLRAVLEQQPARVLEVGIGPGIVTESLRRLGVEVWTLDVNPQLEPDVCASVTDIPLEDKCVDATLCCQVLEHLPFEQAQVAWRELSRITRRAMVMSLPDVSRHVELTVAAPKLGRRRLTFSPPRLRPRVIDPGRLELMGHHWEIGYRGYGLRAVRRAIEYCGWNIRRTWRVPELSWHRFFLLQPEPCAAGTDALRFSEGPAGAWDGGGLRPAAERHDHRTAVELEQ